MLAAYYAVWVVSPLETVWLLNTTFDRLIAQLWPLFVLAAFSWPHSSGGAAASFDSAQDALSAVERVRSRPTA
jgi:hypothetical protein